MKFDPTTCGEVVLRVLSQMAYAFGELDGQSEPPPPEAYIATVRFTASEGRGHVSLAAGPELCRELTASFLGVEPDLELVEETVLDALGEVTNVVTSHLLGPDACAIEDYVLEPPSVVSIDGAAWSDLLAGSGAVGLRVEGAPLLARIALDPAP